MCGCNRWILTQIMRLFFVSYSVRLNRQPYLHNAIFMSNTWLLQHREQKKATARGIFYVSAGVKKKLFDLEVQLIWIERQFVTFNRHILLHTARTNVSCDMEFHRWMDKKKCIFSVFQRDLYNIWYKICLQSQTDIMHTVPNLFVYLIGLVSGW